MAGSLSKHDPVNGTVFISIILRHIILEKTLKQKHLGSDLAFGVIYGFWSQILV